MVLGLQKRTGTGSPKINKIFRTQLLHPNVKLSAFPETTYKLHGTLRIQEVNAVSAKDSKAAWRRYSKHAIVYVFKPWFLTGLKSSKQHADAWLEFINKKLQNTMGRTSLA